MELSTLKYITVVAENGNITKASNKLNIAQSAISRQISIAENELGVKLFTRSYHGVRLTPEGALAIEKAKEILHLVNMLKHSFPVDKKQISGELRIGLTDNAFTPSISSLIENFTILYPNISIRYYDGGHNYIHDIMKNDLVDIMCTFEAHAPNYGQTLSTNDVRDYGILMNSKDRMAKLTGISKEIYKDKTLVIPSEAIYDNTSGIDITTYLHNILSRSENPMIFTDYAKNGSCYILMLKPSNETLIKSGLVFKPILPKTTKTLYITRKQSPLNKNACDLFWEYINMYF